MPVGLRDQRAIRAEQVREHGRVCLHRRIDPPECSKVHLPAFVAGAGGIQQRQAVAKVCQRCVALLLDLRRREVRASLDQVDTLGLILGQVDGAGLPDGLCQFLPADRVAEQLVGVIGWLVCGDDANGDGLGRVTNAGVDGDEFIGQSAVLEVESFRLLRHVTLRWEPSDSPLRNVLEAELDRRLALAGSPEHETSVWLLLVSYAILGATLFLAVLLLVRAWYAAG